MIQLQEINLSRCTNNGKRHPDIRAFGNPSYLVLYQGHCHLGAFYSHGDGLTFDMGRWYAHFDINEVYVTPGGTEKPSWAAVYEVMAQEEEVPLVCCVPTKRKPRGIKLRTKPV